MNEEKKLSQMLDEIFGDYIDSKPEPVMETFIPKQQTMPEPELEFSLPKESEPEQMKNAAEKDFIIPMPQIIESVVPMAVSTEHTSIAEEMPKPEKNDFDFYGFLTPVEPVAPIAPPKIPFMEKEKMIDDEQEMENNLVEHPFKPVSPVVPVMQPVSQMMIEELVLAIPVETAAIDKESAVLSKEPAVSVNKISKIADKESNPAAYMVNIEIILLAQAVYNQLHDLAYLYAKLIKFNKRFFDKKILALFKNDILEIIPIAQYIYEKIASQNITYYSGNIRVFNYHSGLMLAEQKLNNLVKDFAVLENFTDDKNLKGRIAHIIKMLKYQAESFNKFM